MMLDSKQKRLIKEAQEKVRSVVGDPESCWLWPKYLKPNGYGFLRVAGKNKYVHRISYEMFVGPIPEDMTIDHLCKVRHCVNPAHMEVVTRGENALRGDSPMAKNARKTHCKHGHEFTPENTILVKLGRQCRSCSREKSALRSKTPEVRAVHKLYRQRPEVKARAAERNKIRLQNPDERARRAAAERARRRAASDARNKSDAQ